MIIKSYEIGKIDFVKYNFYLFYGENEGFKNQIIKSLFEKKFQKNINKYDESEILNNEQNFFDNILTKSFFEKEKLIIVSRCTDKIKNTIEEIIEKKIKDIKIILNTSVLDKRSKLRSYFEKNKDTICVPFYNDNSQTLGRIVFDFFKEKKMAISQQTTNLLVDRCNGDRQNLNNELNKIESFIINKKKINIDEILKLTNLSENYSVSELTDNCLAKNQRKTINIINENIFSIEECILIIRTLLIKSKRLLRLKQEIKVDKNMDQIFASFKPPIFWKDKEIVKEQIKNWSIGNVENLIYKISEIELLIKKNSINSINILSDFIIAQSNKINN